ncbi:MAG: hypothetical protein AB7K86_05935 [Rhodospirillales bacterium]
MTDQPEVRPADPQRTLELSREVFAPAIQEACRSAQDRNVTLIDVVNGLAEAYYTTIVGLIGEKAAVGLMQAHAEHVAKVQAARG